jgi:predicted ATP-dependent serine protease
LLQSHAARGNTGTPIKAVFESLEARKTKFVKGWLVLVAAAPGIGKSIFALTEALKSGVPTMYFSADSDSFIQLSRAIAIITGISVEEAAAHVSGEELPMETAVKLKNLPVRFNYKATPKLDDIELSLEAYYEVYGVYPELVIIDNITNVDTMNGDDDPFSGLESLLDWLHSMARDTQACVIGLHHVTGPYNDGHVPIPLSGIKGQIGRVPEMVLTLHRTAGTEFESETLNVSTVKNRGGPADPSGNSFVELDFNGEHVLISDKQIRPDDWGNNYA